MNLVGTWVTEDSEIYVIPDQAPERGVWLAWFSDLDNPWQHQTFVSEGWLTRYGHRVLEMFDL